MQKRKKDDEGEKSKAAGKWKKQRLDKARTITVQFADTDKAPGSSKAVTSMDGLPSVIDVEKFTEARAFETDAMSKAMKNAASESTHRVFQTLPRHLRRRAASHDVRRVPSRLREKAKAEMDAPKKNKKKQLPKRGKTRRLTRTEELLTRQVNKSWLETHLWHAKRMHMEDMWGYRLAVTPTEKSFRPSHRASLHGCILHDASYEAIIELKGPELPLKDALIKCSDPQVASPAAARYIAGSRSCTTDFYKPNMYPFELIGPVEVMWNPQVEFSLKTSTSNSKVDSGKGKQKEAPKAPTPQRIVWIRCHPLIYNDIMDSMKLAARNIVFAAHQEGKTVEIEVADLRDQFNIFELVGPKTSQVVHGALKPVKDQDLAFKKFWSSFGQVQTAGSVPRGMVAGFCVMDPRLNFPPHNTKVLKQGDGQSNMMNAPEIWPSSSLASSEIWDEGVRQRLKKPKFKKKDIDERKSKNLIPGSALVPLQQDDRIPVLLIQRSIEASTCNTGHLSKRRSLYGWTLIIPKGWGMAFFSSLVYTGTRVAGQKEIETQHLEAGCPFFPIDYPCTTSYMNYVSDREEKEREKWEKKPPAKRPSWEKLGTRSPWAPDWDVVLGLKTNDANDTDLVPTQRSDPDEVAQNDIPILKPWLFRGQEVKNIVEEISHSMDAASELRSKINALRSKRFIPSVGDSAESLLQRALVSLSLSIPKSGSPEMNAMMYSLTDEESKTWHAFIEGDAGEQTEEELGRMKYSQEQIIGYITSGDYSLSRGKSTAIGALPLTAYLKLKEQSHRIGKVNSQLLVKFRNPGDNLCRAAFIEILG